MDTILQGLPHVVCYIDDILITGVDEEEHLRNLEEVLKRLQQHGIRLRMKKCSCFQNSVEFLGHCIDAKGLHTTGSYTIGTHTQRPKPIEVILRSSTLLWQVHA